MLFGPYSILDWFLRSRMNWIKKWRLTRQNIKIVLGISREINIFFISWIHNLRIRKFLLSTAALLLVASDNVRFTIYQPHLKCS